MDSIYFYIILFIHLACLITGFGSVLVIDTFGLLWLFKKAKLSFVNSVANITQRLIWIGWFGMVLSGVPLILMKGYLDNLTIIKLFFVLLVGLNGIFLHFIKKDMEKIGDDDLIPKILFFRITLATSISQIGWWSAIFIGFIHRHIEHNINIPNNPFTYILLFLIIIFLVFSLGEIVFRKKS